MRRESRVQNSWRNVRNLALPGALALGILFLPATAASAKTGHDSRGVAVTHGKGHVHGKVIPVTNRGHQRHNRAIRVAYHRVGYRYPTYVYLSTPHVVMHGPGLSARVVAYPVGAPAVYEPGYCARGVHYHPYTQDWNARYPTRAPDRGVHGGLTIRIGF